MTPEVCLHMSFFRYICVSVGKGAWNRGRSGFEVDMPGAAYLKPVVGDILELQGGPREPESAL